MQLVSWLRTLLNSTRLRSCAQGAARKLRWRKASASDPECDLLTKADLHGGLSLDSVPEDAELGTAPSAELKCVPCQCNFCKGCKGVPFVDDLPRSVQRQIFAACLELASLCSREKPKGAQCILVLGELSSIELTNSIARVHDSGSIRSPEACKDGEVTVLERHEHSVICQNFLYKSEICGVDGDNGQLVQFSCSSNATTPDDDSSFVRGRTKLAQNIAKACDCVVMMTSQDSDGVIVLRGRRGDFHRHNYRMGTSIKASATNTQACVLL